MGECRRRTVRDGRQIRKVTEREVEDSETVNAKPGRCEAGRRFTHRRRTDLSTYSETDSRSVMTTPQRRSAGRSQPHRCDQRCSSSWGGGHRQPAGQTSDTYNSFSRN